LEAYIALRSDRALDARRSCRSRCSLDSCVALWTNIALTSRRSACSLESLDTLRSRISPRSCRSSGSRRPCVSRRTRVRGCTFWAPHSRPPRPSRRTRVTRDTGRTYRQPRHVRSGSWKNGCHGGSIHAEVQRISRGKL
jgi:hypothetical protein